MSFHVFFIDSLALLDKLILRRYIRRCPARNHQAVPGQSAQRLSARFQGLALVGLYVHIAKAKGIVRHTPSW